MDIENTTSTEDQSRKDSCAHLRQYQHTTKLVTIAAVAIAVFFGVVAMMMQSSASDIMTDITLYEYSTDFNYGDYEAAANMASILGYLTSASVGVCGVAAMCWAASGLLIAYRKDAASE